MQILTVDLGSTSYPIMIGPGLLRRSDLLTERLAGRDVLIVTDTTVGALYLDEVRLTLRACRVSHCVLPDGERHKTLQAFSCVIDALIDAKLNRDATVLALGGGVVGDIAGFAAACYQRGVSYVQLPTTLLAQVDSSVGGKTGVNHPAGKNLIGAFHQPLAVIADIDTLATLPDRELGAGLAEIIKYGCIRDASLFDWLENNVDALLARDAAALASVIARCCAIKAAVAGQDEREGGVRAILNFGHTFGHALEAATGYDRYLHGEAVALGMIMAADLSCRLGFIAASVLERLRRLLERARLPTVPPRIGAARALELMSMDKKVLSGTLRLVLLAELGHAVISGSYPRSALDATLSEYLG
ncbi:MAG: 3-dehydroquinate synthase [Pseudomonadota bacterium]|nr:3-dehydroquinate synthase [Pseudomonadota bacterium]